MCVELSKSKCKVPLTYFTMMLTDYFIHPNTAHNIYNFLPPQFYFPAKTSLWAWLLNISPFGSLTHVSIIVCAYTFLPGCFFPVLHTEQCGQWEAKEIWTTMLEWNMLAYDETGWKKYQVARGDTLWNSDWVSGLFFFSIWTKSNVHGYLFVWVW